MTRFTTSSPVPGDLSSFGVTVFGVAHSPRHRNRPPSSCLMLRASLANAYAREAVAAGAALAAAVALYNAPGGNQRIVRAHSGVAPPDMNVLQRRPSWEAKFEGHEISQAVETSIGSSLSKIDEAGAQRLQRRPSWASKFEFEAATNKAASDVAMTLNEGASRRLKKRPSWSGKFEGHEISSNLEQQVVASVQAVKEGPALQEPPSDVIIGMLV